MKYNTAGWSICCIYILTFCTTDNTGKRLLCPEPMAAHLASQIAPVLAETFLGPVVDFSRLPPLVVIIRAVPGRSGHLYERSHNPMV